MSSGGRVPSLCKQTRHPSLEIGSVTRSPMELGPSTLQLATRLTEVASAVAGDSL
jgi:hypothetical protein